LTRTLHFGKLWRAQVYACTTCILLVSDQHIGPTPNSLFFMDIHVCRAIITNSFPREIHCCICYMMIIAPSRDVFNLMLLAERTAATTWVLLASQRKYIPITFLIAVTRRLVSVACHLVGWIDRPKRMLQGWKDRASRGMHDHIAGIVGVASWYLEKRRESCI
jgi:hypothetical protein